MNVRVTLYILSFFVSTIYSQRTTILKDNDQVAKYHTIPQEKVFVHYNSSLLFSGENLQYKIYCFNTEENHLSSISKIAYVVLLDENGKSVFEHKVKLDNGVGNGDFFVPVTVPSGNYKIIAYTQWMLNVEDHFFQEDLSILNPYQFSPGIVANKEDLENTQTVNLSKQDFQNKNINLTIDQTTYKKRSLVSVTVEDLFSEKQNGKYSLSIIKKNVFPKAKRMTSVGFSKQQGGGTVKRKKVFVGSSVFLPEMRGELIYGKIEPKEKESNNNPLKIDIGVSIPQNQNDVRVVSTNDNGEFVVNLANRKNKDKQVLIEVLGTNKNNFKATILPIPSVKSGKLDFYQFKVSPELEDTIVKRSIYNQIENNYYTIKPDTIVQPKAGIPFYGNDDIYRYNLDDYTRFRTIKETLVEVIDGMWTTRDENGKDVFGIRGYYPEQEKFNYTPLLLIDGVIEQDQHKIINSEAKDIVSISYLRDRYYLGSKVFGGIVILETKNKDYSEIRDESHIAAVTLPELQVANKKYFKQQYNSGGAYDRIPDYRRQLLWLPNLHIEKKKKTINFFTSDVPGTYEISLEGFSSQGVPVSIKKDFVVK